MQPPVLAAGIPAFAELLNLLGSSLWLALLLLGTVYRARLVSAISAATENRKRTDTAYMLFGEAGKRGGEIDRINTHVETILHATGADRACVFQFHNGSDFLLSDHQWKVSCSIERHNLTAIASIADNQGLLVSQVSDFVTPMLSGEVKMPGVRPFQICEGRTSDCDLSVHGLRRALRFDLADMRRSRVTAIADQQRIAVVITANLLHRSKRIIIGFLALQFEKDDGRADKAEKRICEICRSAADIEELLVKGSETPRTGFWKALLSKPS